MASGSEILTVRGRLVKGAFGTGSKSEHEAIYLVTPSQSFKVRRLGANPFFDPILEQLVDEEVEALGRVVAGSTLVVDSLRKAPPP